PSRSRSCVRYRLRGETWRSSDSMCPPSFAGSCNGMLKTTASTPMWPNEKFCAVGGFCTRNDPSQFQKTVLAPAQPMLMFFQNRAVSGAWTLSYRPPVAHCSCGSLDEYGLVALQSKKTFPLAVGCPIMNECRPL